MRASSSATRTPSSPSRFGRDTDADVLSQVSRPFVADERDHLLEDTWQITARDVLQDLRTGLGVRTALPAHEHVDRINDVVPNLHVLPQKAYVAARVVAAPCRTAGPMHREVLLATAEPLVQLTRGFQRELFRFDERHVAIIDAGAAHHAAYHVRRIVAELTKQRLSGDVC